MNENVIIYATIAYTLWVVLGKKKSNALEEVENNEIKIYLGTR